MSRIAKWLSFRSKERIKEYMVNHMEKIVEVVNSLAKFYDNWSSEKEPSTALFEIISHKEKEADNLRRRTLELIAEAKMDPNDKSYLARIIGQMDMIADWSLEAARILTVVPSKDVPSEIKKVVAKMIQRDKEATNVTYECISSMFKDPIKTLELTDKVERIEEDVDELYQEARKLFVKACLKTPLPTAILMFHAIDSIEMVADRCEDTNDVVREFTVRYR